MLDQPRGPNRCRWPANGSRPGRPGDISSSRLPRLRGCAHSAVPVIRWNAGGDRVAASRSPTARGNRCGAVQPRLPEGVRETWQVGTIRKDLQGGDRASAEGVIPDRTTRCQLAPCGSQGLDLPFEKHLPGSPLSPKLDLPMPAYPTPSKGPCPSESAAGPKRRCGSWEGIVMVPSDSQKQRFMRRIAHKRQGKTEKIDQTAVYAQICVLPTIAHNKLLGYCNT